jgi:uncharacterized repeat protein (TIGR02543 family)
MRRFTTALITLALSTSGLVFSPAQAASSFARKLSIVIAVALLGGVLAPVATATSASAATSSGFNYDLDGNNNATVTGCDGTCPANLVIPSTLDNNPVTVIGSYAFDARTEIISVTIPASVASIGNNAFDETELTSITFAEDSQLTSIGVGAFASATSLTSITIPASVTSIGISAFYAASALNDVNFLGNAPTVGSNAFLRIHPGAKAHISATATDFGSESTWQGLVIDRALPVDGNYVCTTGLLREANDDSRAYTITDGVITFASYCNAAVVVADGVLSIPTSFYEAPLTSVTIPASVTSIGQFAFQEARSLETVTFAPEIQLLSIGEGAFENTSLTSITIPASVTSIEQDAFKNINSLETVTFAPGSQLSNLGTGVFRGATALTSITIPPGVTSLRTGVFFDATALTSVTISEGVTSLGDDAFRNTALTSVTIPASVTSIGNYAFSNVATLNDVNFLGNAPTVGINAFSGINPGATAHISFSATDFGTASTWHGLVLAFTPLADGSYVCTTGLLREGSDDSRAYTITNRVVTSGRSCNAGVKIPAGVTKIDELAFSFSSLTSINIPTTVTSIGNLAFTYATALTSINIPASVTSIGTYAFSGTTSLTSITVDSDNQNFTSFDGVLFNKNKTKLIRYPFGKSETSYAIPASVTSLGEYAFLGINSLNSITIPASVTSVDGYAFHTGSALRDVNFLGDAPAFTDWNPFYGVAPGAKANISATAIGFGEFGSTWKGLVVALSPPADGSYVCTTGLLRGGGDNSETYTITNGVVTDFGSCMGTTILIADGVTSIGNGAFYGAIRMTSVTIPGSVTAIAIDAFADTNALTNISVDQGNKNFTAIDGVLFNKDATTLIRYPQDKTGSSYAIPQSVTHIESEAFQYTKLTSLTVPAGVTSIGEGAFLFTNSMTSITVAPANQSFTSIDGVLFNKDETRLIKYPPSDSRTSYAIPASVTSVGDYSFMEATSLTSITIPASVTSIGDYAFGFATSLKDVNFLGNEPTSIGISPFDGLAAGAKTHIKSTATGFGTDSTWNGLVVQADLHEVIFSAGSGSAVSSGVFIEGRAIESAPVSTRSGYTLSGWSETANGRIVDFPYIPTADITLYAIWTKPTPKPMVKNAVSIYLFKFSASSSVMTQTDKTAIQKIVSKSGKDAKYTVTGGAGKVSGVPDSHVKALAKARAEKVKAYLVKLGVKKSNISIEVKVVAFGIIPKTNILAKYSKM